MTERKNQRKHLTYNASQKAGERYNLRLVCQWRKLDFSLTLVGFLFENIALKTLEKAVKTDAQLKEKNAT